MSVCVCVCVCFRRCHNLVLQFPAEMFVVALAVRRIFRAVSWKVRWKGRAIVWEARWTARTTIVWSMWTTVGGSWTHTGAHSSSSRQLTVMKIGRWFARTRRQVAPRRTGRRQRRNSSDTTATTSTSWLTRWHWSTLIWLVIQSSRYANTSLQNRLYKSSERTAVMLITTGNPYKLQSVHDASSPT